MQAYYDITMENVMIVQWKMPKIIFSESKIWYYNGKYDIAMENNHKKIVTEGILWYYSWNYTKYFLKVFFEITMEKYSK